MYLHFVLNTVFSYSIHTVHFLGVPNVQNCRLFYMSCWLQCLNSELCNLSSHWPMVCKAFSVWRRTNFSLEISIWLILITFGSRQVGNGCWRPNLCPTSIRHNVCVHCDDLPGSWGGQQVHWGVLMPSSAKQGSWAMLPGSLQHAEEFWGFLTQPHTGQQQAGAKLHVGTATAGKGYGHLQKSF